MLFPTAAQHAASIVLFRRISLFCCWTSSEEMTVVCVHVDHFASTDKGEKAAKKAKKETDMGADLDEDEGVHDSPADGAKPILDSDTNLLANLKGRHVQLYWPDDNKWYDAEVLDFNTRNKAAKYVRIVLRPLVHTFTLRITIAVSRRHLSIVRNRRSADHESPYGYALVRIGRMCPAAVTTIYNQGEIRHR